MFITLPTADKISNDNAATTDKYCDTASHDDVIHGLTRCDPTLSVHGIGKVTAVKMARR